MEKRRRSKTIGKHISNALKEELEPSTVAKFATVQMEGDRTVKREVEYYNLDMIISVGYRVKSKRGVEFRRWANRVLKQYIMEGYAVNQKRLDDLGAVVKLLKRVEDSLDAKQVLDVVEKYNTALELLDAYHNKTTDFRSYFICFDGGARLEIMTKPKLEDQEKPLNRTGYAHIAFSVGSKEKVDELTGRFKADGFEVVSGPRTTGDGYYESCVVAIEGNQIEITE